MGLFILFSGFSGAQEQRVWLDADGRGILDVLLAIFGVVDQERLRGEQGGERHWFFGCMRPSHRWRGGYDNTVRNHTGASVWTS
jgi:hypothetical protein